MPLRSLPILVVLLSIVFIHVLARLPSILVKKQLSVIVIDTYNSLCPHMSHIDLTLVINWAH